MRGFVAVGAAAVLLLSGEGTAWGQTSAPPALSTSAPSTPAPSTPAKPVTLEPVVAPELIRTLGSRYMIVVRLPRPVDVETGCRTPSAPPVPRIESLSVTSQDARHIPPAVFRLRDGLTNHKDGEICLTSEVVVPLTVDPSHPLTIEARLSDGSTISFDAVQLDPKVADEARQAADVVQSRFDLLHGDDDGRIGVGWRLAADLRLLAPEVRLFNAFDEATVVFEGETAAKDTSLDFKETMTLSSQFVTRFGPIGQYYELVLEPLHIDAAADGDRVDYKGGAHFLFEVPGSAALVRSVQPLFGGCRQSETVNCAAWGLLGSVGYTANTEVKREAGAVNRSSDFVTTAAALWEFPINDTVRVKASYSWQSDSDDGSSSEKREIELTVLPRCDSDIGLTVSWIDGEFLPGDQDRNAVRFGLRKLFGPRLDPANC